MGLYARDITKSFAGHRVLNGISLVVDDGTVHSLVGANGSGKSTLVRLLSGVYQPDTGEIEVSGQTVRSIASPQAAQQMGIRVVHQEAPLIDTMTVAECVATFHRYPRRGWILVDWARLYRKVDSLFQEMNIPVRPTDYASQLTAAHRAMVSLAIALDGVKDNASLLILDEADAAIPDAEAQEYLNLVVAVARSGIPVLMVTHRLGDVAKFSDNLTVLANGTTVYHGSALDISQENIVNHMVSSRSSEVKGETSQMSHAFSIRDFWNSAQRNPPHSSERTILRVEKLSTGILHDVTFSVDAGEIVGMAGLADSGVDEIPLILSGALPRTSGNITIGGRSLRMRFDPSDAIAAGVALLPADRLRQGGIGSLTMEENFFLPDHHRYWRRAKHRARVVNAAIRLLDVMPANPRAIFGTLSGGNQQKVILAKWLQLAPSLLILDDPTSGVDAGSRKTIFSAIEEASSMGASVLISSTELDQLNMVCSRVLVFRGGEVVAELKRGDNTLRRESLMRWCYA